MLIRWQIQLRCLIIVFQITQLNGACNQPKTNLWRKISIATAASNLIPTTMDTGIEEKTAEGSMQNDSSANSTKDLVTKTRTICVVGIFFSLLISNDREDWTPYNEKLEEFLAKSLFSVDDANISLLHEKLIIDLCYKALYRIACSFASIINPIADGPEEQKLLTQLSEGYGSNAHLTYFCNQITIYPPGFPTRDNASRIIDLIENLFKFLYQCFDSIDFPPSLTHKEGEDFKNFCLKFNAKFNEYETTHADFHKTSRYKRYEKRIFREIKKDYPNGTVYVTIRKSTWYPFAANKQILLKLLCSGWLNQVFIQRLESNLTILGQHIGRYENFDLFFAAIRTQIHLN